VKVNIRRLALVAFALVTACAADQLAMPEPDFALLQLTQMPDVASHTTGNFPVQYRLQIGNRGQVPITLKALEIASVGMGAYDVPSQTRPFNIQIAPGRDSVVDFFANASVQSPTILGANGPVTLHGIVTFYCQTGEFQKSFMLQANEMPKQ
jgi:hypothetical protein